MESEKDTPQEGGTFWFGPEGKVAKIFEIDAFCSDVPGRRLVFDGVMGRGPSREAQKYMYPRSDVPHRDNRNQCLRASILNTLWLFCAGGADEKFIEKEKAGMESRRTAGNRIRRYRSVRCLGKALGEFMPRLELGHIRDGLGTKRDVGVNFLVRQGVEGVLLVAV